MIIFHENEFFNGSFSFFWFLMVLFKINKLDCENIKFDEV